MVKKTRESNIELLRIIAVMGVIVLHFNGDYGHAFQYIENSSVNGYVLRYLESLFIPAVNIFILITGFYLSSQYSRRIIKAVYLIIQVMFFGALTYIVSVVSGTAVFSIGSLVSSVIPCNYYVILYIALYLISPYINLTMEKLQEKQLKVFLTIGVVLFAVWPVLVDILQEVLNTEFQGLNTVGLAGDQSGYTIVNFCLLYIIGAYIRTNQIVWSVKKSVVVLIGCTLGLTIWSIVLPQTAWGYCNPLVILEAVAWFLLFKEFHIASRFINGAAKAVFTCFLFHGYFVRQINAEEIVGKNVWVMIGILGGMMVTIYFICWCAYYLYSFLEKYIIARMLKGIDRVTINVKS